MTDDPQANACQMAAVQGMLETKYLLAQEAHAAICEDIRHLKQILEDMNSRASAGFGDAAQPFQITGGDVAWRTWVAVRRDIMASQLAELYARRDDAKRQLKAMYGRYKAAEAVAAAYQDEHRKAQAMRASRLAEDQALMRLFMAPS